MAETLEQLIARANGSLEAPSIPPHLNSQLQLLIDAAPQPEMTTWQHIKKAAGPAAVQNVANFAQGMLNADPDALMLSMRDKDIKDIVPNVARAVAPEAMAFRPQGEAEMATMFMADPTMLLNPGRSLLTKGVEGLATNSGAYYGDRLARESGNESLRLPLAITGAFAGSGVRQGGTELVNRAITPAATNGPRMLPGQLDTLKTAGIKTPSAGQIFNNDELLAREASSAAGAAISSKQLADFTSFEMSQTGSRSKVASIDAIRKQSDELGPIFENAALQATGRIPIVAGEIRVPRALQEVTTYMKETHGTVPPILQQINKAEMASFARGIPVDGATLKGWRSQLSAWRLSNDQKLADLGSKLLPIVDSIIYHNLPDDEARQALTQANSQYSALMDIFDSLNPSSVLGARGMIDPKALAATIARKKGLPSQSLPLAKTATALNALPAMPTNVKQSTWGPVKAGLNALGGTLGAISALPMIASTLASNMQISPHIPQLAGAAALTGAGANWLAHRLKSTAMNPNMQRMYNQVLSGQIGGVRPAEYAIGAASMPNETVDDRQGRKSGGRVSPHDADADQLVRAAERAKKGWSAETEPLLKQSDEAVAHALEVANRSI